MNRHLSNVEEFHKTFSANIESNPIIPSNERINLRLSLILEELTELAQSSGKQALIDYKELLLNVVNRIEIGEILPVSDKGDIVQCLDALSDIDYVMNGTVLEYGLHKIFDLGCEEVHKSNMSKVCKTREEASDTINFRREVFNEDCEMMLSPIDEGYIVYRTKDKKTMKSIKYSPANLNQFFK